MKVNVGDYVVFTNDRKGIVTKLSEADPHAPHHWNYTIEADIGGDYPMWFREDEVQLVIPVKRKCECGGWVITWIDSHSDWCPESRK